DWELRGGGLESVAVKWLGGVGADLDPGADVFLLWRLLVDVRVAAGPKRGKGRRRSTDPPADDRGRQARHLAVSHPVTLASMESGGVLDVSAAPRQAMC